MKRRVLFLQNRKVLTSIMKANRHFVKDVEIGSIAEEMGIEAGDELLEISGQKIEDIFDYQFYCTEEYLEVLIRKPDGEEWLLEIDKDENEDLGIQFENGLMDEYHSCHNKCIFCFIDQMPPGMRETLYFKDDDTRLSFLQGNYVTLTNLSDHDIDRMIRYHLEPINISFQTMNPTLRCKMLNNRFAGEALKKAERLFEAGIRMNGQIVLCKGVNDGEELRYSLNKLLEYLPVLESVSVVPVGLSKYREGLYPLEPFTKEEAREVIAMIEEFQKKALEISPYHFVHASDEWYLLAELPLPKEETYDGYLQLENGVGMLRLLHNQVEEAILEYQKLLSKDGELFQSENTSLEHSPMESTKKNNCKSENCKTEENFSVKKRSVTMVTGQLAYPTLCTLIEKIKEAFPFVDAEVCSIRNDFFGENITVSGLITGQDLIAQLKEKKLGEVLLLPQNMLRSGEEVFLDDITVSNVQNALQVQVGIVKSSGMDFVESVLGIVRKV